MAKINVDIKSLVKNLPNVGALLALTDRICADEGATNIRALNKICRFSVPRGDIINLAGFRTFRINVAHIGFLFGILSGVTAIRRVADYVIDFGREGLPIDAQGVGFDNRSVVS